MMQVSGSKFAFTKWQRIKFSKFFASEKNVSFTTLPLLPLWFCGIRWGWDRCQAVIKRKQGGYRCPLFFSYLNIFSFCFCFFICFSLSVSLSVRRFVCVSVLSPPTISLYLSLSVRRKIANFLTILWRLGLVSKLLRKNSRRCVTHTHTHTLHTPIHTYI